MAFDPSTGEAVLIGGFSFETRVWDGAAWRSYPGSPAPLTGAPLVFDGQSILAVTPGTTFRWSNNSWQSLPASTPPHGGFRVAYDESRQRVVGFGGAVTPFNLSSETWEWDGRNWTQLSPATTPPGRTNHAMAYDRSTGRVVMFGGETSVVPTRSLSNETWVWDGTDWTLSAGPGPSARRLHTLVGPDPVLLHGGMDSADQALGDLWRWAGPTAGWEQIQASGSARARATHAATLFDGGQGMQMLVVEGITGSASAQFQTLNLNTVHQSAVTIVSGYAEVAELSPPRVLGRSDATTGPLPANGTYIGAIGGTFNQGGSVFAQVNPVFGGHRVTAAATANGVAVESVGSLTLDFEYTSPVPVSGFFQLDGNLPTGSGESRATIEVDIRGDGTIDYVGPVGLSSFTSQLLVGPSPMRVRVRAYVEVDTRFNTNVQALDFTVSFRETASNTFQSEGTACGGQLDGAVYSTTQRLNYSFQATGLSPTPHGFFVVGFSNPNLVVPPTGCRILADFSIPLNVPIFPGRGVSDLNFSIGNLPGVFRIQHIYALVGSDNITRWYSSNALQVTIP